MKLDRKNCIMGFDARGKLVLIPLFEACSPCKGTGKKEHTPETCPICAIRKSTDPNCNVCHGTGRAPTRQIDCPGCHGIGRHVHQKNAELIRDALVAIGFPPPAWDGRICG